MLRKFYVNEAFGNVELTIPDAVTPKEISQAESWPFHLDSCAGKGNLVFLGGGGDLTKLKIKIKGSNNSIYIGANCILRGGIDISGNGHSVFIGYGTTFNNVKIICKGRGGVYIGRDCMFSSSIEMRTADGHAVIDLDTKRKVNLPDGIYVGDHVWVSKGALIQKGAKINSDNIVGYGALVKGVFEESNGVIVGTPAKVAKNGKTWSRRENVDPSDDQEIFGWKNYPLFC